MYVLAVFLLIIAFKVGSYFYKLFKVRLQLSAIPQPPLDSIISGHKPSLDRARAKNVMLELFMEWMQTHGDTVLMWIKAKNFIITVNPDIMDQMFNDAFSYKKVAALPSRAFFEQKIIGYHSILSSNSIDWATKRKIMARVFAKSNMPNLFKRCKEQLDGNQISRLMINLKDGKKVDMTHLLSVIFTSYLKGFGMRGKSKKISEAMIQIIDGIPLQLGYSMNTLFVKYSQQKKDIIEVIKELRENLKNSARNSGTPDMTEDDLDPADVIGHLHLANRMMCSLIKHRSRTGDKQSTFIEFMIDDLMTLTFVTDNMVKQLGALFISLEEHPEVREKMFKELRETPITDYASLASLRYTEKCLLESLRYSPALLRGIRKYKTKTNKFGPYNMPSPIIHVIFSQYLLHHDPNRWDNPNTFDPERWSEGFSPPAYSYMPFLVGPRSCLGRHYAIFAMKLTLSKLVQNFDITPQFDKENRPSVSQTYALMRLNNKVECFMKTRDGVIIPNIMGEVGQEQGEEWGQGVEQGRVAM